MVSRPTVALAVLLLLGVCALSSSAEIPDGQWRQLNSSWRHEELWTRIVLAAEGKGTDCTLLGSLVLQRPSVDFPALCRSRALVVGSDTFDFKANESTCHFKKCGTYADIAYTDKRGAHEIHTILVGRWHPLTRAAEGVATECPYLGSYKLPEAAPFPASCESRAAVLGGDTFDAKPDGSKCYFKRCGTAEDIKFTDAYGARDTYSVLREPFVQVVRAADGVSAACASLAEFAVADPATDFPAACSSKAAALGADTFEALPNRTSCHLKKCGSPGDLRYSAAPDGHDIFTSLGVRWMQLVRAADGVGTTCVDVGSLPPDGLDTKLDLGDFPQACYSKALALGGDTFDVKPDHSKCYFKKCGSLSDMRFTDEWGGHEVYTVLSGGWLQITDAREGLTVDCRYLGSYKPANTSSFPEACFSQAAILGADTFDSKVDGSKCYFKQCETFSSIKFSAAFGARNSFTRLFPRGGSSWGPCDPAVCLDMNLLYTSALRGHFLPVNAAGKTCDPDASGKCFGGTARRIAYFERMKEELERRNESAVVFDMGGGIFGGPLLSMRDYPVGRAGTILSNLIPYDFCVLSPRDFLTVDGDRARVEMAESFGNRTCTFLLANARLNGLWKEFGATKVAGWTVRRAPNGWKTAFIGMMPYTTNPGYNYGRDVMTVDPTGLLSRVRSGAFALEASSTALDEELHLVTEDWKKLRPHFKDVVALSSLVSTGVKSAMAEVKRMHPDVKATVLLVGDDERADQVEWLAQHEDVDVIVREAGFPEPTLIQSLVGPKQVLVVGSSTQFGVGHLKARLRLHSGVERFDFKSDVVLDSSIATNATVEAMMSEMYEEVRERRSRPYGNITNPLVGGHRGEEAPPSKNQCYNMECSQGTVIGRALLWEARRRGFQVDVSIYNLGGVRNHLQGNDGVVFITHCVDTLSFQNSVKLFKVLGKHLYEAIRNLVTSEGPGFVGAGMRVAFHEPCYDYVSHEPNFLGRHQGAPGTAEELQRCRTEGKISSTGIRVIEVEVAQVDWESCEDYATCDRVQWRPLEKGTVYTVASIDYLQAILVGFKPMDISLSSDAEVLCEYIAAHSPLQVESWEDYLGRGNKQYETAQDGWAAGMRVTSVKTPISTIELAPTCPDGMHLPKRATKCMPCPAGSQSTADPEREHCQLCALGFYSERPKASSCSPCPAGYFANASGSTACFACGPGTVSDTGAIYCNDCRPGQYAGAEASRECLACPVGKFAAGTKSSACASCREGLVTEHPATTSSDQCLCPAGSYGAPAARGPHGEEVSVDCLPCPRGMRCPFGSDERNRNGTSPFPQLLPGYWSSPQAPLNVFKCRSQEKCLGGDPGASCAPRLVGQACELCEQGWRWQGERCSKCGGSIVLFPLLPLLLVPVVVCAVYYTSLDPMDKWGSWKNAVNCLGFVVVSFYQTLGLLVGATVKLPTGVADEWTMWAISTDFTRAFWPNCVLLASFAQRTVSNALVPTVMALLSFLTMACSILVARQTGRASLRMHFDGIHHVVGSMIFTFFSGIVASAMTLFKCADNPNGSWTLAEDASITCYDSEGWRSMLVVGVLCVLVNCIAAGAAFVRAVLVAPRRGNFRNPDFQWRWKFLFVKYRPEVYWFSIVYLLRNFLINLCFVPFSSGIVQVYCVMTVVLLYSALLVAFKPFRFRAAYALDLFASSCSIYTCAFLLRFGEEDVGVFPAKTASKLALTICLLPPATALLMGVRVLFKRFVVPARSREDCDRLFQLLSQSCSTLLAFPQHELGSLLMEMGEWDRQIMVEFGTIIRAEVLGVGGYRMITGKAVTVYRQNTTNTSFRLRAPRAFGSFFSKMSRSTSTNGSSAGGTATPAASGRAQPRPASITSGATSARPSGSSAPGGESAYSSEASKRSGMAPAAGQAQLRSASHLSGAAAARESAASAALGAEPARGSEASKWGGAATADIAAAARPSGASSVVGAEPGSEVPKPSGMAAAIGAAMATIFSGFSAAGSEPADRSPASKRSVASAGAFWTSEAEASERASIIDTRGVRTMNL